MKKRNIFLITMLVFLLILTGCGETKVVDKEEKTETVNHEYDKQINLVLKEENEAISYADEVDRDLKRKECNFKVYDNGQHIYIQYPREKGVSRLEDSYSEVRGNEVFSCDSSYIVNKEPDYIEMNNN